MTLSIWRYSHVVLAITSSIFLIIASLTGIILAVEPMQKAMQPYRISHSKEISLSETITSLNDSYEEVLSLEVDPNGFVSASVITKAGDAETFYIDPRTGKNLGKPQVRAAIFQFATHLHRSLFLKGIGRFFVGSVSFLLCLIAITGFLLIIKRQGGIQRFLSKIREDDFALRYHVVLGRWFLFPIVIVAATGVYLSAEKFSLLPDNALEHRTIEPETKIDFGMEFSDLPIFNTIVLGEVRSVNFPFSKAPEDYFEISLNDKEIYVHQYTGKIISEAKYPFSALVGQWSLLLHTGQGSPLWSLVLVLASISILFFIYSGFVLWRKRMKSTIVLKTETDKDTCSHIILVGSEMGTTFKFAEHLGKALLRLGKTVFISELNAYTTYAKARHLIVLTATYGKGEATTNAQKFEALFTAIKPIKKLDYSVVGFGSVRYPHYCAFAITVENLLLASKHFNEALPLYKINDQNEQAFQDWAKKWGKKTGIPLFLQYPKKRKKNPKSISFEVQERTALNQDHTFLIRLRPQKNIRFQSGDLAGIVSRKDGIERLYSIAKIDNDILLSVKKHEFGVCSPYLSQLRPKTTIQLHIKKNPSFHFPGNAKSVIFIANGTGIAPFLGMVSENAKKIPVHIFLGLRTKQSLELYADVLSRASRDQKLSSLHIAYSMDDPKIYVQDLIQKNTAIVSKTLAEGGSLFICGSLAMQKDVLAVLETISQNELKKSIYDFEQQEQLKMDCY